MAQKTTIGKVSLNLILRDSTLAKKVLDAFGNDGFRGNQDVAMMRSPCNRAGLLIGFTAIVATPLVQRSGCNLVGQRRDENGDSIVGGSEFGNSLAQIVKSRIFRMLKRSVRRFHRVPSSADAGTGAG